MVGSKPVKSLHDRLRPMPGNQKLANGYFANGYVENQENVPRMPPFRKIKGGKRLDPSDKKRWPANPPKNVHLSSH